MPRYDWVLITGDFVRHFLERRPPVDSPAEVRSIIRSVERTASRHFEGSRAPGWEDGGFGARGSRGPLRLGFAGRRLRHVVSRLPALGGL